MTVKAQKEKVEQEKLVTFQLGPDMFAAGVFAVERVLRHTPPSSVPDVPEWVEGVIEYQGGVIPVIDMRRRMSLPLTDVTPETRTLVFATQDGRIGAIVDAVHEVAVIPRAAINPPPAMFRGLASEFVRGIAKVRDQLVVVLDVDRVLTSADRIAFDRAVQPHDGAAARG
jgi:purine-binding chemotaxis protein CheW